MPGVRHSRVRRCWSLECSNAQAGSAPLAQAAQPCCRTSLQGRACRNLPSPHLSNFPAQRQPLPGDGKPPGNGCFTKQIRVWLLPPGRGQAGSCQPGRSDLWDSPGGQPGLAHCRKSPQDSPYTEAEHGPGREHRPGRGGGLLLIMGINKLCVLPTPRESLLQKKH